MTTLLTDPRTIAEQLADTLTARARRGPVAVNDRGNTVGQDHHRAKLTDHDVWLIHDLRANGVKRADIAAKFECSLHTVIAILAGRRRTHIATSQRNVRRTG